MPLTPRLPSPAFRGTRLAALSAAALALAGCQRDEVTHAKVPKAGPEAAAPGMPSMPPPGMAAEGSPGVPPPPAPADAGALRWTLPKGWTQSGASAMRYATLKVPLPGKVDVSVVVLPGPAGGELANVNRWRGQIGLPPIDEAALSSARKAVASKAGTVSVFDFTSDGQVKTRMVAGLLSAEGNTWFVKMVGDADPVGTARPEFIHLLESLRLGKAD